MKPEREMMQEAIKGLPKMTLDEIKKKAVEELPMYEEHINNLIKAGRFQGLFDFLRTSHRSEETSEIRYALLEYVMNYEL